MKSAIAASADGLSPVEARALQILRDRGPQTCARLGEALWGRTGNGNCSCPWARPAGALLHKMLAKGLVRKEYDEHFILWAAKRS